MKTKWVYCPVCGRKTRTKIRPDTRAENLIVFCPVCKNESLVDIKRNKVNISSASCQSQCQ